MAGVKTMKRIMTEEIMANKGKNGTNRRKRTSRYYGARQCLLDRIDNERYEEEPYGVCRYGLTREEAEEVMGFGGDFISESDLGSGFYGDDPVEERYIEVGRQSYREEYWRYIREYNEEPFSF